MDALSTQIHLLKLPLRLSSSCELVTPSYLCLLQNPILENSSFSSKQSSFVRGQFWSRHFLKLSQARRLRNSAGAAVSSSCVFPLTEDNVEKVLNGVRPGIMIDGGNVVLHEIDCLVVVLKLQGACGSCPSSTMTTKMGIETRLHDKISEIEAVEQILETETGPMLNEENVEKATEELSLILNVESRVTVKRLKEYIAIKESRL